MGEAEDAIHPVILCGGSGTRLWPRSRKDRPKPFQNLLGERSLFQQTLDRVADQTLFASPTIVAGAAHAEHVEEQLDGRKAALVVEPCARNTAPAIALAAASLPPEAVMLVCPSDHAIADIGAFLEGVQKGAQLARDGYLVAFGITPTRPETGYGYIEVGEELGLGNRVARFVEKPDVERARDFLQQGNFVWNGGIFLFRADRFLRELERFRPEMVRLVREAVSRGTGDGARFEPEAESFGAIAPESVDYAVMEQTDRAAVVAADMGWSDIGDWNALFAAREAAGLEGEGLVDRIDATGVHVTSDGPRVSVVGLSDVIVVVDGDEVLVTSRAAAQQVGQLPGAKNQ